ncbi:amidohydrolase family protein [Lysobacter auxotrophicus]|uniref:Amidohydrolase family protein n=1 Tax=Lysobacter auxotrophicus TaxID=2992573 RepID=A0ABM8DDS2_9GAMM|nr:amidohydrolase family protein [Lysobacter auxotrophicus]BDU16744.1 amidohydrolase family protein [Lysobacter auxotrophicus]
MRKTVPTLCAVASALLLSIAMPAMAQDLAIVGARVFPAPDAAPIDDATVLIRDGRITAVGPRKRVDVPRGTQVVDGRGTSVTAGFWNSHVHLIAPPFHQPGDQPAAVLSDALRERFTQWGFTTLFDIASLPGDVRALRGRIERGDVVGPQLLTVDMPFYPEHGTPIYVRELWEKTKAPSAEIASAEQGRSRAASQIQAGADGVKLFTGAIVGGPRGVLPMSADIARAIVEEAHAHGKPAFAHPTDQAGLDVAIDSGVDVLAHTAPDAGEWSPAFVARLKADDMALVPTLTLFDSELRRENVPEEVLQRFVGAATQQVRAMAQGGGQILFGTDAGYIEVYDTHLEYRLMSAAGMDWRQILTSLTTAPAQRFGQGAQRGRIAQGYAGDLVLLRGDPRKSNEAFADVRMTVRDGRVIHDADAATTSSKDK